MKIKDEKIVAAGLLVFAGGVIGAGLVLLLSPQTTGAPKKNIFRVSRKVSNSADDKISDISSDVISLVDNLSVSTEKLMKSGRDTSSGAARHDLIRMIEEGASTLEKLRTILRRM